MPDKLVQNIASRARDILSRAEEFHASHYRTEDCGGGPALHFHRRALEAECGEKTELIYAVMISWGMHRAGTRTRVLPFQRFADSLAGVQSEISCLLPASTETLSDSGWRAFERIFKGIKIMESRASLVGNSKVLAHLLPNLAAPVDRRYTLGWLFGNGGLRNDIEYEWRLFRKIHEEFYYSVLRDDGFRDKASAWMADKKSYPWDTSPLKVIDNLVIGAQQFCRI